MSLITQLGTDCVALVVLLLPAWLVARLLRPEPTLLQAVSETVLLGVTLVSIPTFTICLLTRSYLDFGWMLSTSAVICGLATALLYKRHGTDLPRALLRFAPGSARERRPPMVAAAVLFSLFLVNYDGDHFQYACINLFNLLLLFFLEFVHFLAQLVLFFKHFISNLLNFNHFQFVMSLQCLQVFLFFVFFLNSQFLHILSVLLLQLLELGFMLLEVLIDLRLLRLFSFFKVFSNRFLHQQVVFLNIDNIGSVQLLLLFKCSFESTNVLLMQLCLLL